MMKKIVFTFTPKNSGTECERVVPIERITSIGSDSMVDIHKLRHMQYWIEWEGNQGYRTRHELLHKADYLRIKAAMESQSLEA